MKIIRNQSGYFTLMTVVIVSIILMTTAAMSFLYSNNRLKYHTRIKESYKLMNAIESAGIAVRGAFDAAYANCSQATPSPSCTVVTPGSPTWAEVLTHFQANQSTYIPNGNAGANPCSGPRFLKIPNVDDPNNPYCFSYVSYTYVLTKNDFDIEPKNLNRFQKFARKLDAVFEANTMINYGSKKIDPGILEKYLGPNKAMATVSMTQALRNCSATPQAPECYRCNEGTGSYCVKLSVCPSFWGVCVIDAVANAMQVVIRVSAGTADPM